MEKSKKLKKTTIPNKKVSGDLVIANVVKVKRAADLVISNIEKSKLAAEIVILKIEKAKYEDQLVLANKKILIQNINKAKRAAQTIITNIENARLSSDLLAYKKELGFQNQEEGKRATELIIAKENKAKRAAELVIFKIEKAKRAAKLVILKVEMAKQSAELIIAKKELVFLNQQKSKRSAELLIANIKKANTAAELVIEKVEKAKRAAELVILNKELALAKENEKLVAELVISNKELNFQIVERKQIELDLIIAKERAEESDRLKSNFLSNMSHEIRTPMNGILGFAELLKEPNLTKEEQQDFIKTIGISGARMLNTINNIVDISKIESGQMKVYITETNINEKIEFTYKFFKPEVENKGLKFSFKYGLPEREAIIKTDNEKVYGILTNLLKNSIKFTHDGSIEFGYLKKGEYLEFFIKDTGIGIPPRQKELIFGRFIQGSVSLDRIYEGSGLGLSISKSYIEMLGGKIWVKSDEGRGSTFYFTIPYHKVSDEIVGIENVVSDIDKEFEKINLKILVVEDDETSFLFLTRILQKLSNKVLHAKTGVEAVEFCHNNPDLDLVLMDIRMHVMDGLEATRQIRQFNRDVIIIAQTAFAFSGDREKAIEAGSNDYISKPINKTLLYTLIKKLINKDKK